MAAVSGRLERAREVAATIDGWLTDAEGRLLFALAEGCPVGSPIVEIGSWKGKSTVWLASGVADPALTRVFAIDPHRLSIEDPLATTLDDLRANIAKAEVEGTVVTLVTGSHEAAVSFDRRPGVVFIDGNHLEEAVRVDIADWLPKLVDGGALALHDVLNHRWPGPRRALRRLLWSSTQITAVRFVDSIAWVRKVRRNRAGDRLRNRAAAFLLLAYEVNPARLPPPMAALLRAVYRRTPLKRAAGGVR